MAGNEIKKKTQQRPKISMRPCLFGARWWDKKISPGFLLLLVHQTARADALAPKSPVIPRSLMLSLSLMRALTFTAPVFGSTRGDMAKASPRAHHRVGAFMALAGHWPGILNINHHLLPWMQPLRFYSCRPTHFYGAQLVSRGCEKKTINELSDMQIFSLSIKLTLLLCPHGWKNLVNWNQLLAMQQSRIPLSCAAAVVNSLV